MTENTEKQKSQQKSPMNNTIHDAACILYEDDQLLVCRKEAGLPVQSADPLRKDLASILRNHLKEENPRQEPYLGIIHRLDQPVEGLLVFAKTKKAAASLSAQVRDGTMRKRYRARVHLLSETLPFHGQLCGYLVRDGRTNTSRPAHPGEKNAKKALLDYEITEVYDDGGGRQAVVMIDLHTGRHHQIRVQFADAGMPLCGDRKYGIPDNYDKLALCACSLSFIHPTLRNRMTF